MGFGVNNFNNNQPIIKGAQSAQDGGAGNLGYFEREEKKRKEDEEMIIFSSSSDDVDTFNKNDDAFQEEEDFSIAKLIAEMIFNIKEWFKKIFGAN